MKPLTMIVAGGGTGGHFFSGFAMAEKFLEIHPQGRVVFVGTRSGIEGRFRLEDDRMSKKFVVAKGFKNQGILGKIQSVLSVISGMLQSFIILLQEKPKIVIGVGGYASVSMILAAYLFKIFFRYRLFVIDQNSSPGVANRLMVKLGIRGYCPFRFQGFQVFEMPLRKSMERSALEWRDQKVWPPKSIFIMGGSQGAQGLNQAWLKMLKPLRDWNPQIQIFHQTGLAQEDYIRAIYEDLGIKAEVFAFSNDLSEYYRQADLIIGRAGALSVFESIAFQRPTIFIPYPFAADNHQYKNAQAVQKVSWILSEDKFTWNELKLILEKPEPQIPQPIRQASVSAAQLLR